ncbi:type I-E CRISPR-associated protein Cas6/Cse3/CasE [Brachybacterium huguangmaarense]|uniref:Type I-E CRISPR-associated protein Cas6/Cse3/CasE n=1 Tax=Brachybacterium huguangmaarense TaxID=1652028 RepID=A0ABY6G4C7_9MICO|nr:type I-E CRISPR-associated protein Cas6/Cse3/CasE [Brachybacterium huguangmaarense]UYG17503.1 type I-E CRISPR-associated protein Cas6/Cse3/CasE [Brachybacterium huguangmaarense]
MTTFTRILLNPQKRGGRRLLSNPQAMHAAVRASFPPDLDESTSRILWRVDHDGHEHTLYIVGPEEPDRSVIVDQAGWAARPGETADYDPLLDGLRLGHERRFRLTANPVRSLAAQGQKRGKIVPHVTPAQQVQWLVGKASAHGFEVRMTPATDTGAPDTALPDVIVDRRENLSFTRRDKTSPRTGTVTLRTARFDGSLRITDVEAFRRTLTHGIGRGRAYGCGLLTIARLEG